MIETDERINSVINNFKIIGIDRELKRKRYIVVCMTCNKESIKAIFKMKEAKCRGCLSRVSNGRHCSSGTFQNYKRKAGIRKIEFKIEISHIDDLYEKQNMRCALTGIPITLNILTRYGHTASVDRIDSSRGYYPDNIQLLHKDINRMKWDLKEEKFIELCRMVVSHNSP